jgi:hypothetical protein
MVRGEKNGGRHATSENNAILEHVWITFQARLDHISSTFEERTCCVSQHKNSCVPITFKAILEQVRITFQARLDHISSTFQERTCCVTQFQNSCADHNIKQYKPLNRKQLWSMFESHLKHVLTTNILCHQVSKYMCRSHLKQFWSTFGSHFKHVWSTFQEQTCCVNKFQNSSADHDTKQFWSMFRSHFKHVSRQMLQFCHISALFMLQLLKLLL